MIGMTLVLFDCDEITERLGWLAQNVRENNLIGVMPQTVTGPIDVIDRLNAMGVYSLIAFYAFGRGEMDAIEAAKSVFENPFYKIVTEYAESALIFYFHESPATDSDVLEDMIVRNIWNVDDYIVYQTPMQYMYGSEETAFFLVILGVTAPEGYDPQAEYEDWLEENFQVDVDIEYDMAYLKANHMSLEQAKSLTKWGFDYKLVSYYGQMK
jgi:hypothetical protein